MTAETHAARARLRDVLEANRGVAAAGGSWATMATVDADTMAVLNADVRDRGLAGRTVVVEHDPDDPDAMLGAIMSAEIDGDHALARRLRQQRTIRLAELDGDHELARRLRHQHTARRRIR